MGGERDPSRDLLRVPSRAPTKLARIRERGVEAKATTRGYDPIHRASTMVSRLRLPSRPSSPPLRRGFFYCARATAGPALSCRAAHTREATLAPQGFCCERLFKGSKAFERLIWNDDSLRLRVLNYLSTGLGNAKINIVARVFYLIL